MDKEYLHLGGEDPSRACAEALAATLGNHGAIVAYSASVERGCIRNLANRFLDLASDLNAAADRVVDLLPVVRDHYYHRDMRGSFSIKAVLPARLPELSYDALAGVKDGMAAQEAYKEATDPQTSPERREQLRSKLLDYCALDTWAMVRLAQSLSDGDAAA